MKRLIFVVLILMVGITMSAEVDMKYHGKDFVNESMYYVAWACWFKPGDFLVTSAYRIKTIGCAYLYTPENAVLDIYITSKEDGGRPVCNPDNGWFGADYSLKGWNPTYHLGEPQYDDTNVYDKDWHYPFSVSKFWVMYHQVQGDKKITFYMGCTCNKWNSYIYRTKEDGWQTKGWNWWMHCVIECPPTSIESTSLGQIKTLFK